MVPLNGPKHERMGDAEDVGMAELSPQRVYKSAPRRHATAAENIAEARRSAGT